MKSKTLRLSPLASAVALACTASSSLLLSSNALSQDTSITDEITVTGSRIQRPTGFTTPVPVTAVTPE